ncbi:hypothetical protein Tco_1496054 [Tanacetum coccineum]
MDVDLSKVELDEALKAKILNITCDRTRNWILARITSPNICTNMEELFRKLVDVDKNIAQGLIPKEKGADPLIVSKRRNQSIKEIKAIVDRKLAQRDADRDAKRDAVRDAARDAALEVESNIEREASNKGIVQKRRKQSSCESMTIVHGDKEKLKDTKVNFFLLSFFPDVLDV